MKTTRTNANFCNIAMPIYDKLVAYIQINTNHGKISKKLKNKVIKVLDHRNNQIGSGMIIDTWQLPTAERMVRVRFVVGDAAFEGQYNFDKTSMVKAYKDETVGYVYET